MPFPAVVALSASDILRLDLRTIRRNIVTRIATPRIEPPTPIPALAVITSPACVVQLPPYGHAVDDAWGILFTVLGNMNGEAARDDVTSEVTTSEDTTVLGEPCLSNNGVNCSGAGASNVSFLLGTAQFKLPEP
ncbi:hypothetical protein JMJ35_004547 [Cladonia borealis]|uniref:Uncharacterized protein n=1 Tax=Cladonia borealis TaxID=184061 RepID=A0AA39R0E5_9LECA|nr:hypothetical protein JMJ35_004547 [Cladonia borealis]